MCEALATPEPRADTSDRGFTLIEILVVMIIIGVLVAIAIPIFLSQRAKAQDAAAKADVSTIAKELASYFVDRTGAPTVGQSGSPSHYTLTAGTDVIDIGRSSSNVVLNDAVAGAGIVDDQHWCVAVNNPKGDKSKASGTVGGFKYSAKGGLDTGTCVAGDIS